MTPDPVEVSVEDGLAIIALSRPPVNAMDSRAWQMLRDISEDIADQKDISAVVVTGGPKCFGAGGDLREISQLSPGLVLGGRGALQQDAVSALARLPLLVIAAIEGYAMGGGLEIALAADFRVIARNAVLGLPEATLGMLPAAGGTQRLIRLVGSQAARRLLYSGMRIDAAEAARIGLVDEIVNPGDTLTSARDMAIRYATHNASFPQLKRAILEGSDGPLADGLRLETSLWAESLSNPATQALVAEFTRKSTQKST